MLGTCARAADDMEVLKHFYRQTRPWGFWKPVIEKIQEEDRDFMPNRDFTGDLINVVVGISWQMALVVMPIYLLIRAMDDLAVSVVVFVITSWLLKKYWYDKPDDDKTTEKTT